tara:strand:+ start:301 stop:453 length:153 start_codon:yes stop_codon:yes gene_type:complete
MMQVAEEHEERMVLLAHPTVLMLLIILLDLVTLELLLPQKEDHKVLVEEV